MAAEPTPIPCAAQQGDAAARALAYAAERLGEAAGTNGERYIDHARGTVRILEDILADTTSRQAAALFGGGDLLPIAPIAASFGDEVGHLVDVVRQVLRLRGLGVADARTASRGQQAEVLRRMVLAMAVDIRVVLIRLASRLQTLRFHASVRTLPDPVLAHETLDVLAPLANRLGLWQLKWEMEDLAFRFTEPAIYKGIASELEEKRRERESFVFAARAELEERLRAAGIACEVTGRPKHIYSIYAKMRSKRLELSQLRDLRGLRVIVDDVRRCYEALSTIHQFWTPIPQEYDDYIARPKPNGYQSLHTVVVASDGKPLEVQIRTREMHRHAEYGVASHWAYKEQATGLPGGGRSDDGDAQRIAWVRQLLAWQREMGASLGEGGQSLVGGEERIYVMTPQARVVELPAGSTPVDFAYHVHSSLGHRCRGAKVDGQMVPLNTVLQNGQTVEVIAAKAGSSSEGPSRDWLNIDLGYVRSPRARTKVRQWFNALELERDASTGRERVERVLQREGRTSLALDELARRLSFDSPTDMFVAVARDEIGPRALEEAVRGKAAADAGAEPSEPVLRPANTSVARSSGDVLVVGVDLLMTQLARCCRPAPPDPIVGFVTRGRGVSVHRARCRTFQRMAERAPERVLDTAWGNPSARDHGSRAGAYPVDVLVKAADRPGLLRDISDVFARDRLNVIAVNTLSRAQVASMQFTVEVPDTAALARTLGVIREVRGVFEAQRRDS